jgi:ribosomal protein S18 acetylase RimI-like enzyme
MVSDQTVEELREATLEDGDAVIDLITAMLKELASYGEHALDEERHVKSQLRSRFEDSLGKEEHVYLLAPVAGQEVDPAGVVEASIVSPCEVFRQKRVVHVHSLYVRPCYRGQGIGRTLLRAALGWGRGRGGVEAKLTVLARNPARALYESLGFEVFELEMRLALEASRPLA